MAGKSLKKQLAPEMDRGSSALQGNHMVQKKIEQKIINVVYSATLS